jgi:metal-responsive CopG/Arc/MetJ family transcriptional regulator
MKTAVSIPDDVFAEGERIARRLGTSRSRLYANALTVFVARYDESRTTAAMNDVLDKVGGTSDDFTRGAARRVLRRVEW